MWRLWCWSCTMNKRDDINTETCRQKKEIYIYIIYTTINKKRIIIFVCILCIIRSSELQVIYHARRRAQHHRIRVPRRTHVGHTGFRRPAGQLFASPVPWHSRTSAVLWSHTRGVRRGPAQATQWPDVSVRDYCRHDESRIRINTGRVLSTRTVSGGKRFARIVNYSSYSCGFYDPSYCLFVTWNFACKFDDNK